MQLKLLKVCVLARRHRPFVLGCYRHAALTGNTQVDNAVDFVTGGRMGGWLKSYEDMVGLTEVRLAQSKVIKAEQLFLGVQTERRGRQIAMTEIQSKLKEIHRHLDKVQRGEERYLALLTEEYQILRDEKTLETHLQNYETQERDLFAGLSSAVRESHEKERARTERTKYWSIFGSVIGATIGILGTSINNYLRMRELRSLVRESTAGGVELKELVIDLSDTVQSQHEQINSFVTDLRTITGSTKAEVTVSNKTTPPTATLTDEQLQNQTKEILNVIQRQDESLFKDMADLKRIFAIASASDKDVVYVGPEVEKLLEKTENNLEWKIKSSALWTVTFIYGALAITLPVLYTIFKGS